MIAAALRSSLFVTLLLALTGAASAGETAADWTPNAEEDAVWRALSVRDAPPPCADVEALAKDPVATLISVAEHATMPPWVAVRATSCLATGHAEEAKATLLGWVVNPNLRGLAFVVTDSTGKMPEGVALEIARAGLSGPHAADLRKRLLKSSWPSVVALANAPTPGAQP